MSPLIIKIYSRAIAFAAVISIRCLCTAQTPISLSAAIDSAIKNNALLKNEKLKAEYQKILINSGKDIPMTSATMEYGQINSSYYDTKFGLGQSINFPSIYSKQRSVLRSEWRNTLLQADARECLLRKQVTDLYYAMYYLMEKEKLLLRNDSLYSEFLKKSELKFRTGESNMMEKITAETQQGQIRTQLEQLRSDQSVLRIQFMYLLRTPTVFYPSEPAFKLQSTIAQDTSQLALHPSIRALEQQRILSVQNTALEKSKMLPDLMMAYSNMSMRGVGADNRYYTTASRFQSVQLGVGIPLFYGAQRSRINAARVNEQIAAGTYYTELESMKTDYMKAYLDYLKYSGTVNYYENTALNNADIIIRTCNDQFSNGEISYIEYVLLTNQAIDIQNAYIDAIRNLNERIISLNYFNCH